MHIAQGQRILGINLPLIFDDTKGKTKIKNQF